MCFLIEINSYDKFDKVKAKRQVEELALFVKALEMGDFYGERIESLTKEKGHVRVFGESTPDAVFQRWREEERKEYYDMLTENAEAIIGMIIELLRYQKWS
tara:strand:- start:302 stop:604 length:303 start_codon:yes stop_codon:yes gene_type:complete